MFKGIPEIGLQRLEPFPVFNETCIKDGDGAIKLVITYPKAIFDGAKRYVITKVV